MANTSVGDVYSYSLLRTGTVQVSTVATSIPVLVRVYSIPDSIIPVGDWDEYICSVLVQCKEEASCNRTVGMDQSEACSTSRVLY